MNPLHQAVVEAGNMTESLALKQKPKWAEFLDLPPELRNNIYEDLLISLIPLSVGYQSLSSGRMFKVWLFNQLSPNPLAVCRQINEEATSVLYGGNTFRFGAAYMAFNLDNFLDAIGNSRHLVRNITLSLSGYYANPAIWSPLQEASGLRNLTLFMSANEMMDSDIKHLANCVGKLSATSLDIHEGASLMIYAYTGGAVDPDSRWTVLFKEELRKRHT